MPWDGEGALCTLPSEAKDPCLNSISISAGACFWLLCFSSAHWPPAKEVRQHLHHSHRAVLQSITVGRSNTSVIAGGTQQFSATASFSDGGTQNVTLARTAPWFCCRPGQLGADS